MAIWQATEPRWELSGIQGWEGGRGCWGLSIGDPQCSLPCLFLAAQGNLNRWAFFTCLHDPALDLSFARLPLSDDLERNLPPRPFLSAETSAQRWMFPRRRCRRCLLGAQTQEKLDESWLPTSSLAEHPFLSPCDPGEPLTCPTMPCCPHLTQALTYTSWSCVGADGPHSVGIPLGNNITFGEFTPRREGHPSCPSLPPGSQPCRNWDRSYSEISSWTLL